MNDNMHILCDVGSISNTDPYCACKGKVLPITGHEGPEGE
jgi:hypothetical protein